MFVLMGIVGVLIAFFASGVWSFIGGFMLALGLILDAVSRSKKMAGEKPSDDESEMSGFVGSGAAAIIGIIGVLMTLFASGIWSFAGVLITILGFYIDVSKRLDADPNFYDYLDEESYEDLGHELIDSEPFTPEATFDLGYGVMGENLGDY